MRLVNGAHAGCALRRLRLRRPRRRAGQPHRHRRHAPAHRDVHGGPRGRAASRRSRSAGTTSSRYPILRALGAGRPLGMIHVDAHSDTGDTYFGGQKTHARHAVPPRHRGRRARPDAHGADRHSRHACIRRDERDWALDQGIRIIDMEEVAEKGIPAVIAEARAIVGAARPISPSTSTPSIRPSRPAPARPKSAASRRARRYASCAASGGLDLVGADVVEVSPPLDPTGNTALVGRDGGVRAPVLAGRGARPPLPFTGEVRPRT